MKSILAILLFLNLGDAACQEVHPMDIATLEDSIKVKLNALRSAENNAQREIANIKLKSWVEKTIWRPEAFDHPFDSLKTMGSITSPDEKFRLFNWNIEHEDGTQSYYCYVVKKTNSNNKNQVIELEDKSVSMRRDVTGLSLDNTNWYGGLYYKIIPVKKGSKLIYTLLAYDGNNRLTTKKYIETMYFAGSKKVKFGYPMIKDGKTISKRYFLEFTSDHYVSLKHQVKKKEQFIVFDHLSPKAPQLEGVYEHYVTDGSYDAFQFVDGYWILKQDVDQRNPAINKEKFNDPLKDDYDYDPKKIVKIKP